MPPFPIIDAHVHLWDTTRFAIPWLAGVPAINRVFDTSAFTEQATGLPIQAFVFVEVNVLPEQALAEVQWALACAQVEPRLQGIVAAAPVEQGDAVRNHLNALQTLSPLIKGVRRPIQDETDPFFCLSDEFVSGVRLVGAYGWSFDLCLRHTQLAAAIELVRQCPETAFMLDHLGKPDVREHTLTPWREELTQLAALPNVFCKLSGLVTEADPMTWTIDELRPYVDAALVAFGEDRVVFGGDWPVLLLASSYPRWIDTLAALTAHLPEGAQRKLWAENARRFYRISNP
ncbi:MAG TPA: amidohydrolase family protein [Ktedonobacterales bacterium]|nr:amidohydrolase family protein [Ktedonobacterales bacterium]